MDFIVRKGTRQDLPATLNLIQELAEYENAPDEVEVTVEEMERAGFSENPLFHLFVAETEGKIVGIALYYFNYSTWKGRALYLDDIVVSEQYRRQGIGKQLFDAVIQVAKEEKVRRMKWEVLEWNKPALEFYKKYDAELDGEWVNGQFRRGRIEEIVAVGS